MIGITSCLVAAPDLPRKIGLLAPTERWQGDRSLFHGLAGRRFNSSRISSEFDHSILAQKPSIQCGRRLCNLPHYFRTFPHRALNERRFVMALQIGDTAPDFEAETTEGKIRFHDWIGNSWVVLLSLIHI